jgi:Ca-activated chloride channel homolog
MDNVGFRFAEPWFLLLLLGPLLLWWWQPRRALARFAATGLAAACRRARSPSWWRFGSLLALSLLIIAVARPQFGRTTQIHSADGRNLMLVLDLSGSMQLEDMRSEDGERQDRFAAVMNAAKDFLAGRPNDRLGLVVFAENALTSCPLTYDHSTLIEFIDKLESQQRQLWRQDLSLVGQGTNFGLGMGVALRRLKEVERDTTAIILITDGQDTRRLGNWVDPLEAARHAHELDIRIYAVGVGNAGGMVQKTDPFTGRIREMRLRAEELPDMDRLRHIASLAGGQALAAGDPAELKRVLAHIDQLETTSQEVRVREDYSDRFLLPLVLGSLLWGLLFVLEPKWRGPA